MLKILVVEDETAIRRFIKINLERQGFEVLDVESGEEGLDAFADLNPDIALLDVMLPGISGLEVAKRIRELDNNVGIIMLTAKSQDVDKILGLESGADDYMTKPFIPEELLARIRALSRRQGEVVVEELHFGDLVLNLSTNDLLRGRKSIHLGYKEFEVLKLLMNNAGKIISKDTLISRVWGNDSDAEDNNVEAYISFLRKKLFFLNPRVEIVTVRKVGYRLEEPSC